MNIENDLLTTSFLLMKFIYCFRSSLIIISSLLLIKINEYAYTGPEAFMRYWKAHTNLNILERKDVRSLHQRSITTIATLLLLLTIYGMYMFISGFELELWKIVDKIAAFEKINF